MASSASQLHEGRDAFQRRAWTVAHQALGAAHEAGALDVEDLQRLAVASFLVGDEGAFVEALQEAHQLCVEADRPAEAALHAFWVGFHLVNRGEASLANGWFARAARLIDHANEDCAAQGYLLLPTAQRALINGEPEEAARAASQALRIAERFGDAELLAIALYVQGRALLRQGRMAEGLASLDEAMVAAAGGELGPQVTGLVYCGAISACREVYALDRAHEWTAALSEWCESQPEMVPYAGECRVYRAEILQLSGEWARAMDEARRAGDCFERGHEPGGVGLALYQQGELHRLRGELTEAEAAYRAASQAGREPQPGLALLRLAQGDEAAATAAIRRALAEITDPLRRARLLPAYIEIMLESGDVEEATRACRELAQIAASRPGGAMSTLAAQAEGAVALASGDAESALGPLRSAWHEWQSLAATYEVARTRMLLGIAFKALGDDDGAQLELEAARAEFERLGAAPDLARLERLTAPSSPRDRHGLTDRELEVLGLLSTGRTNRAIADDLFISEKTVARHVANIFGKIGVSSRAAATAFAYEHDLAGPST